MALHFFIIFFSIFTTAASLENCPAQYCGTGESNIRFPFGLKGRQVSRCGYPLFDLSCKNNSQLFLNLPSSGDFNVEYINYVDQIIFISDPEDCLLKRLMNFNLSGSPFRAFVSTTYTFYNCSRGAEVYNIPIISCLSRDNYYVTVLKTTSFYSSKLSSACRIISEVSVPDGYWFNSLGLPIDVMLAWDEPNCGSCEDKEGICGFKSGSGLDVVCSNVSSRGGLSKIAKYGIAIGVGSLLCLICICCYARGRIKTYYGPRLQQSSELSTTITQHHTVAMMGLNRPTIESYPKTKLGESGRLPKPNDKTCSICLSEYQPKETLRTIPQCNHYFHAHCIDEWLNLHVTCPLCRNTPYASSNESSCPTTSLSSSTSTSTPAS